MKSKKFSKKLALNKKTIANLRELKNVRGGYEDTDPPWGSCVTGVCGPCTNLTECNTCQYTCLYNTCPLCP